MSSEGTIEVNRVWKRFREDRKGTTVRELLRWPPGVGSRRWRWALKDIDFRAEPGQSLGLIGINGSGKSTLLKVLTRIMTPHSGSVSVRGRVGALIEIRAGIHPELSGRENVYLYGSLLGLQRKEIARKFDEIVNFAELQHAIDRQVKFYSSGMAMRLGFGVSAFLEPDVLLVDEVLAVGDAAFQQRCLDQMRKVLQAGTTLVLVSHDLAAIEAMCDRGLWLQGGVLQADGPIRDVLTSYRHSVEEQQRTGFLAGGPTRITDVVVARPDGGLPATGQTLLVRLTVESTERIPGRFYVGVSQGAANPAFVVSRGTELVKGRTTLTCEVEALPLAGGAYALWCAYESRADRDIIPWHHAASFTVGGPEPSSAPRAVVQLAPIHVKDNWTSDHEDASSEVFKQKAFGPHL